ncbi:HD domain-containing protein [Bacillus sp. T33-2]|uniref:HD domain-containing protein n=1 Tax=Bacillus sp. T33-2 TaxID=2054168 RepID=UPI000C759D60|nr:HD domain-containing protein [Bacillus sp. T33-2]PLR92020.1 phosphohydrolase [Bacillus sp. T33-2]
MELIDKALQVASRAHQNQFRKQTDIPYVSHPAAVGMILLKAGYSEEVVAAGILHDTVEDTDITLQDIEQEFGSKIAEIVEGCSEPDKSLSWEERKEHTIEFLKTASAEIRAVACADKLHNLQSVRRDYALVGDSVWNRFKRGRLQQEWYYRSLVDSLGSESNFPLLEELRQEVDRLFSSNHDIPHNEDDFSLTEDAGLDKDDILGRTHPNLKNKR